MRNFALLSRHTLMTAQERRVLRKTYAYLRRLWRWALWVAVISGGMLVVGRAIALKSLPKHKLSKIRFIPTRLEAFVLNPEFGTFVLP
jgi:hypothetical protein